MYNVRIYKNTGLNAVNIVDKPSLLNDPTQFTFESVPALDIVQNVFLSTVKVKATWQTIKAVDYCRIGNSTDGYFYYFVQGVRMCAVDVAELDLVPDFITSAGGIEAVEILDGIVTRCHVSDDTYGAWNIEDEFLTPSEPLILDTHQIQFGKEATVFVESSLDLGAMGLISTSTAYIDSEDEKVQVPQAITNFAETSYTLNGNNGTPTKTTLFIVSDEAVKEGINNCRALGIESSVRTQVSIPTSLVSETTAIENVQQVVENNVPIAELNYIKGDTVQTRSYANATLPHYIYRQWKVVTNMSSSFVDNATPLQYEYQQVNNKRVLYGSLNRVGILTTAGNRLESNPEETRSGDSTVVIRSIGDPHPTGAPYHRFKTMNGNSSTASFFINAVKGLPWKQIPLMYSEPSGNALNAVNFQNSRDVADLNYNLSPTGAINNAMTALAGGDKSTGNILTMGAGMLGGALAGIAGGGMLGGGVGAAVGGLGGAVSGALATGKAVDSYNLARKQEMQQFAIQQHVSSPDISISYDGEAFRDFYGETVIVYRYRPTPTDIARLDNILTMYGYKVNIAGKDAPVNNRQYFNYLMGNLTVGGNLPKWMCDGITLQIANGVRIWHVKPSSNYYNSNPIK